MVEVRYVAVATSVVEESEGNGKMESKIQIEALVLVVREVED